MLTGVFLMEQMTVIESQVFYLHINELDFV